MALSLANVISTDTFSTWLTRTNEIIRDSAPEAGSFTSAGGTINGNLTVNGDALFSGNTTILSKTTIETTDALMHLAANNEYSDILDIGFFAHYYDGASNNHTGIIRDSVTKEYYIFSQYKPGFEPTDNININHASFELANTHIDKLYASSASITGTLEAQDINSTSDVRLKMNINPIEGALDKVMQLAGVEFDWADSSKRSIGVVAQQVEEVLPELVHTNKDGYKSVSYGNLTALLIEAIKELSNSINKSKDV
jgi:hypothetical protein